MPIDWRIRALSVEAAIDGDAERAALQLAALLRIDTSQARLRLENETLRLREAKNKLSTIERTAR